jgi:hypothetical protein
MPGRGAEMKNWSELIKNLTMLTQFGLSLITPLILCIGISWYLDTHTGIGGWIYIAGFFFGLGGSGMFAYKTFKKVTGKTKKKDNSKGISFNRHE